MAQEETAPIKEAETQTPTKKAVKATKPTNVKKIVLIVVGIFVGIIVVIIVIAMLATSGPRKVSDSFIKNIQAKNATAAYADFSAARQLEYSQDQFKQIVDKIAPVLTGEPSNNSNETNSTNGKSTATVVYTIKGTDATYKVTVDLVKESTGWKVDSFASKPQ